MWEQCLLRLEAAAAMVFAAGVICGSLLTCCCLSRRRERAEFSRLKKEPTTVSGVPLPSSMVQCEKVYFPVSGSKVHLNPSCSGMVGPMSKDLCSKCCLSVSKRARGSELRLLEFDSVRMSFGLYRTHLESLL